MAKVKPRVKVPKKAKAGDVVISLGAGDINKILGPIERAIEGL